MGLTLVDTTELALSDEEKAELAKGLAYRDQYISAIDEGPQSAQHPLAGEPSLMPFSIAAAYLMIAVLIGIVLFWVRPHWRDLEKLRLACRAFSATTICRCAFNCRKSLEASAIWPSTSI